jgi:WD40 repeat protein
MRLLPVCPALAACLSCAAALAAPAWPLPNQLPPAGQSATARIDQYGDPLPKGALLRLGSTRYHHRGFTFVGFSPDGRSLLFLSWQGYHWADLATGKFTRSFAAHIPFMRGTNRPHASMATQAPILAMGMDAFAGQEISITDANSGRELTRFTTNELFQGNSFSIDLPGRLSPDGKLLIHLGDTLDGQDVIRVFETLSRKKLYDLISRKDHVFAAATLSPDGKQLVAVESSENNPVKQWLNTWDLAIGNRQRTAPLYTGAVNRMAWLADGKGLLAAADGDARVRLVDTATGKEIRTFPDPDRDEHRFAVSADGKLLYTSGRGKIQEWQLTTGKPGRLFRSDMLPANDFAVAALAPDGKHLVGLGWQTWTVWDLSTGKELHTPTGHTAAVGSVAFAPDGLTLVTAGADRTARLWDAATGKQTIRLDIIFEDETRSDIMVELWFRQCAFSADGKVVAANGREQGLHLWDAATGQLLHRIGDQETEQLFTFGPRGQMLALHQENGQLSVWNVATGKQLRSWAGPVYPRFDRDTPLLFALAWSPDGRLLAIPGQATGLPDVQIELWETATSTKRKTLKWHAVSKMESQLSAVLEAQTSLKSVGLPDLHSFAGPPGAYTIGPEVPGSCTALVFTPDSRHLAVASADTIYLFDIATGKQVRSFGGPNVWGRAIAFSPDGKLLAAGRKDGSIRLWQVATGTVLCDVLGHERTVSGVAFSPSGQRLASASLDGSVLVWDVQELLP